jgi:hypothetical protein
MCIKPRTVEPERLRRHLLEKYSTGTIAQGPVLRLAFSSTPFDKLDKLFENIYRAGKELAGS